MLQSTLQFLIAMIACALNERMQKILDYKAEEVHALKEMLKELTGKTKIDFTEDQRRRLAEKGKELTPNEREEHCEIIRPKTILDWYRRIFAAKYDSSKVPRKKGRPPKPKEVRELVVKMALENPGWGYTSIRDAVNEGLGIDICRNTVANILNEAGILPAPERQKKRTWRQFIRSHWESLYACDFFTVEVLHMFGTMRYSVFFVMEVKTRIVEIAGITVNPDGRWMCQIARNLIDPVDGFLRNAHYLIHDGDPVLVLAFKTIFGSPEDAPEDGIKCVQIPARSPNCNPHAERFVKSIKYGCLRHFVFFGERHLRYVIKEWLDFYHAERFHQGIGSKLIRPKVANDNAAPADGPIKCRSRLGGLLNFYYRDAA